MSVDVHSVHAHLASTVHCVDDEIKSAYSAVSDANVAGAGTARAAACEAGDI
jgi:hypothetical protein